MRFQNASCRALGVAILALLPAVAPAKAPPAGSLVVKAQDRAQPTSYSVGGALAIREDASYQFLSSNGPVRLDIGRITNESTTTTSGTVRAALFVTSDPTPAGTYHVIAQSDLGTLQPGFFFGPLSHTVSYLVPPDGTYFIHAGVFEYEPGFCSSPDGFCLDDWVTFTDRVDVIDGLIYDAGPPTGTAVEYYHTGFNHYFITSLPNEIAALDAGVFQGWVRTAATLPVWTANIGNLNGVCRFFSTSFDPKSSHFYTPYDDECQAVLANPDWQLETIAFYALLPNVNGNCALGTQQLFRLYNNGMSGAPNHRYTNVLAVRNQMLTQGWITEGFGPLGVIACLPI